MLKNKEAEIKRLENLPLLSPGEIHLWQVPTDLSAADLVNYKKALSPVELAKVPFFEFKKARDSYVASQGALRMLLAGYTGISADLVKIGRRNKGKPYSVDNTDLYFNLSNSGSMAVIAFVLGGELGVDIEKVRQLPDLEEMINTNFTAREIKFIKTKPEEKLRRFFRFWTIKESYLKAIGEGMRLTPDNLEFSINNNYIRQLSVKGVFEQEDWEFKEFTITQDYVGTITCGSSITKIKQLKF